MKSWITPHCTLDESSHTPWQSLKVWLTAARLKLGSIFYTVTIQEGQACQSLESQPWFLLLDRAHCLAQARDKTFERKQSHSRRGSSLKEQEEQLGIIALYTSAKDPRIHKHILIRGPRKSFWILMFLGLLQSPLCQLGRKKELPGMWHKIYVLPSLLLSVPMVRRSIPVLPSWFLSF